MYDMTFYCTREADGTIHIQNAVMGMMGQHHVHTEDDFGRWRGLGRHRIPDKTIEWLESCEPCDCGLQAGEVQSRG